jgi:PKD repeat protein
MTVALLASINLTSLAAYGSSTTLQAVDSVSGNTAIQANLYDTFTVNMTIKNVTGMFGHEFRFYWNSSVLNCTGSKSIPPPTYGGGFVAADYITVWNNNNTGRYWLSVVSMSTSFTGDYVVAQLNFTAIGAGESRLKWSDVQLGDSLAEPIACTPIEGIFQTIVSDIAIISVIPKSSQVIQGSSVEVDVEVLNKGNVPASSSVSAFSNNTSGLIGLIGTQSITNLAAGMSQNLTYEWDTGSLEFGIYTLYANATGLSGEFNITDNQMTGGSVEISGSAKHDVAVTRLDANATVLVEVARLTVEIKNQGWMNEGNFTLDVYSNNSLLYSVGIPLITTGSKQSYTFSWSTSDKTGHYGFVANMTLSIDINRTNDQKVLLLTVTKAPIAVFTASPTESSPYQEITFDASASTDPDGAASNMTYTWEFGDSTYLGLGKVVKHWYSAPGNYTVTLTLTNEKGLTYVAGRALTYSSKTQHEITVKKESPPIISGDMLTFAAIVVIIIEALGLAFVVLKRKPRA